MPSPLQEFRSRHLFDYAPAGEAVWWPIVLLGLAVAVVAMALLGREAGAWGQALVAAGLVLAAGKLTASMPGSKLKFSGSDIFLFGTLGTLGAPAAVLVAGLDVAIAAARATPRLSSRLFSPASAMLGMTAAAAVYGVVNSSLVGFGANEGAAAITGLTLAGLAHHTVSGTLLRALLAFKKREALGWVGWFADTGWMASASVLSAFVASIVLLTAGSFGLQAVLVSALAALAVMALAGMSTRRVERERKQQEALLATANEQVRVNQQRFTAAFERAAGGLAIVAGDGKTLRVNPALCELIGQPEEALLGRPFLQIVDARDRLPLQEDLASFDADPDLVVSKELRVDGARRAVWVSLHASRFEDPGASGTGLIFQLHDISDRRAAQEQLQFAAYHDGLTSLPNRLSFLQSLQAAIDRSKSDPTATFAALLLDLDRFKMVNDSLGHAAGNDLLVEVARRLAQSVRTGDFVARLGGDEFGLMFDQISSQEEAVRLGQRVAETVAQPMQIAGTEFTVQCSIGLTLSDLGHRTADEMIRDADIAMYDAKGKGRGRISVFDTPMHDYVADRLHMEAELRRAISAGQITLAYQPILRLEDRRLLGFEALARWRHPELGQVEVPKFIALAEESGFIAQLTPWVIEMAALQMAAWQRELPDGERLKMHVNISARDLELAGFTTSVATALARARLSGHALTLEITETSLMRSMEHALPVMESLRRIGVGFSIDDFGTGYSSLSYLSALPIESLKIDRSFVLGMDRGPQNVEIVRAILRLGQTLHMHVIAEGVETHDNLSALREIGVESGQGYLFSRPLPAAELQARLQEQGLRAS